MAERILQRLVLPPRRRLTRLYYRSRGVVLHRGKRNRRAFVLPRGTALRTDTWFNAFFESYWRTYTTLTQPFLRLRVSGAGILRLYRRSSDNQPSLLQEIDFSGQDRELRVELADTQPVSGSQGLLFFEVEARSLSLLVHQAEWATNAEVPRPTRLVAGLCTFNRASQLIQNITALLADSEVVPLLDRVLVVDQGEERVRDHPDFAALMRAADGRLHLLHQDNRGGAGGFTRCLLEARNEGPATHVLLMDDDILPEPESVLRAAAFLSLARGDLAVGGHMLDRSRPCQLVESGSRYLPERLRIDEPSRRRLDRTGDLLPFLEPQSQHYNGWWFFAFPLPVLKRTGLPLPLFLRGDDVEFGCRLLRHGVPTVALPGVAVWHEPFERKSRGWHAYYELRTFLIVGALHFPILRAATVARRFFSRVLDELLAYDYYEAWLLCEAATAYLAGPEMLRRSPLLIHNRLQAMAAKLAPRVHPRDGTEPTEVAPLVPPLSFPRGAWERTVATLCVASCPRAGPDAERPSVRSHAERGNEVKERIMPRFARAWRWWFVFRNLWRSSPSPETRPQRVLQGSGEQWYDVATADVVGVAEPHRSDLVVLRRSRQSFVWLFFRSIWLALRLLVCHRRAVRGWRASVSTLTSQTFWTDYLQLRRNTEPRPLGSGLANRSLTVAARITDREVYRGHNE